MIQIKLPVRAYKRLIYLAFASSFLCFLALHLAISYQRVHVPLETLVALDGSGGGHTTATASGGYMSFRGLLQKSPLEQQQSLLPSAASPQLFTSTSAAAAASINGSADNKTRTAAAASAAATAVQSTNSVVQQASAAVQSSAVPPASPSAAVVPPTSALISNLSKEGGAVPVAVPTVVQSEQQQHQPSSEDISQYFDIAPHVDHSPSLSEVQQLNELEQQEPHLALNYWQKAKKYPKAKAGATNKSCRVDFPSLYELEFNNIYWQKFNTANSSFYLYGAYYDDRWRGGPLPMVRILAMIDRVSPPPALCQIWFDRISVPIISQATYIYGWYNKWGNYHDGFLQPYIVTCKIPRIKGLPKDFYPTSVSLVENRCHKATNNLRILNDRPPVKQQFAVCVKGLDFLHEDLSVRLVEWIELLRLLGANKIFLYELEIHPNISKVLQHYQQDGIVELTKITLPGNQPNLPGFRHLYLKNKLTNKRQNELIPYNDCLYRNLYRFEYIALLDIDEIIMPLGGQANWSELMAEVQRLSLLEKNYTRASYNVRNVYFLDDLGLGEEQLAHMAHEAGIPRYLHMLQHVYRSQNYTKPGQYVKCFHNTERAVSLHNHFPLNCFGTCTTYSIPVELAHLQHYRKDCVGPLKKSCKEFRTYTTRDTTIFKYKDPLISSTTAVLKKLGFFDGLAAAESAASAHQQL